MRSIASHLKTDLRGEPRRGLAPSNRPFTLALALLALAIGACAASSNKAPREIRTGNVLVSGLHIRIRAYCGGPALSSQEIDAISTPRPDTGHTPMYVRRGATNTPSPIVYEMVPDSSGHFEARLPPGIYCIVRDDAMRPTYPEVPKGHTVDKACIDREWAKCWAVVYAGTERTTGLELVTQERCGHHPQPCTTYIHPPPS